MGKTKGFHFVESTPSNLICWLNVTLSGNVFSLAPTEDARFFSLAVRLPVGEVNDAELH